MKTADEFVEALGNRNERIDFATKPHLMKAWAKLIQADALKHAAQTVESMESKSKDDWSITRSMAFFDAAQKLKAEAGNL